MRVINILAKSVPKPPTYGTFPITVPPTHSVYLVKNSAGTIGYAKWSDGSWYTLRKTIAGAYEALSKSSKLNTGPTYWNKI